MNMILLAGVVRVAIFVAGLVHGIYQRRILQVCAFGLVIGPSMVFMVSNAGIDVPMIYFQASVYLAAPTAALLVGMMLAPGSTRDDGWRIW